MSVAGTAAVAVRTFSGDLLAGDGGGGAPNLLASRPQMRFSAAGTRPARARRPARCRPRARPRLAGQPADEPGTAPRRRSAWAAAEERKPGLAGSPTAPRRPGAPATPRACSPPQASPPWRARPAISYRFSHLLRRRSRRGDRAVNASEGGPIIPFCAFTLPCRPRRGTCRGSQQSRSAGARSGDLRAFRPGGRAGSEHQVDVQPLDSACASGARTRLRGREPKSRRLCTPPQISALMWPLVPCRAGSRRRFTALVCAWRRRRVPACTVLPSGA